MPVRLSLTVSAEQVGPAGHRLARSAAALTATVSPTTAASNQAGPDTVDSLVHSARRASRPPAPARYRVAVALIMRPSDEAARRPQSARRLPRRTARRSRPTAAAG